MKILFLSFLVIFMAGCSLFGPTNKFEIKEFDTQDEVFEIFEAANKKLDKKNYRGAIKLYKSVLLKKPTSDLEAVTLYNIGYAYEHIEYCNRALKNYKKSVELTKKKKQRLFAQTHYRMSMVYQCKGRSDKVIVSLLTAYQHSKHLPVELAQAEVPARLAAAYARNGNKADAKKFFKKAESGIRYVNQKYKNPNKRREMLAKTLYYMGKLNILNLKNVNEDEYLSTVNNLQGYLLQSAELNSPEWSSKASKELVMAYRNTWTLVKHVKAENSSDRQMMTKLRQDKKNKIVNGALNNIIDLKSKSYPATDKSQLLVKLNSALKVEEQRLRNYLVKNSVNLPLTPEAQERNGLKRKGRLVKPEPEAPLNKEVEGDPNL